MSYLSDIWACEEGSDWADSQKNYRIAWELCERADWMIWVAVKQKVNIRTLTLAKVACARLVEHVMTDQRSIDGLNVGERFGRGEATEEELICATIAGRRALDLTFKAICQSEDCDQDYSSVAYQATNAAYLAVKNGNGMSASCGICAISMTMAVHNNHLDDEDEIIEHALKKCADIIRQHISYDDLNIPEDK